MAQSTDEKISPETNSNEIEVNELQWIQNNLHKDILQGQENST